MKILFVVDKLEVGGTERSAVTLCNYWVNKGYDIYLIVIFSGKGKNDYFLEKNVKLIYLADIVKSKKKNIFNSIHRLVKLRILLNKIKPNLILSFLTHVNVVTIIFSINSNIPRIISERNYPPLKITPLFWIIARKFLYRYADCLVVQTKTTKKWIDKNIKTKKTFIIPNPCIHPVPLSNPVIDTHKIFKKNIKYIIAVGRFDKQKGFEILIKVFSKIIKDHNEWNLIIVGDGNLRKKYINLIKNLKLENKVILPGRAGNIQDFYNKSDIFVLSSKYEGFPNVLLEAMSNGLPVISTNCKTGPSDIINHYQNGILISLENFEIELFNELKKLIIDHTLREKLSNESIKVKDTFSILNIHLQWENLFKKYA